MLTTGEAYCEARLVYDGLEVQPGQSLGDLYQGFEKYSISGLPMPLPDKPLITQMSDTHVTLTWKPGKTDGYNASLVSLMNTVKAFSVQSLEMLDSRYCSSIYLQLGLTNDIIS